MARPIGSLFLLLLVLQLSAVNTKSKDDGVEESEKWKKKDVRDYNDADVERLLEQWEDADEDELEPDELPEWKREPPKVDMSKLDPSKPEEFVKLSKKGRTLMMFATVAGDPSEKQTEEISALWHSSLFNANVDTQRFVVGTNRVLFMCRDGAQAWDVKDFLVLQENCDSVEIEGQTFTAKGGSKEENETKDRKKGSTEKKKPVSKNAVKKDKSGKKKDEL